MGLVQTLAEPILCLPARAGPRPRTRAALPHLQLDQLPPARIVEELVALSLGLPDVRPRQSRMASPLSCALSLPDAFAAGPPAAFIDDHEFCHLHPPPEGSLHLTLPQDVFKPAIELGWAERHPASRLGIMTDALVTVYAPRNAKELGVVFRLIWNSYQFARGA